MVEPHRLAGAVSSAFTWQSSAVAIYKTQVTYFLSEPFPTVSSRIILLFSAYFSYIPIFSIPLQSISYCCTVSTTNTVGRAHGESQ